MLNSIHIIEQISKFKNWCKKNGLKPSHAKSLHMYMEGSNELD